MEPSERFLARAARFVRFQESVGLRADDPKNARVVAELNSIERRDPKMRARIRRARERAHRQPAPAAPSYQRRTWSKIAFPECSLPGISDSAAPRLLRVSEASMAAGQGLRAPRVHRASPAAGASHRRRLPAHLDLLRLRHQRDLALTGRRIGGTGADERGKNQERNDASHGMAHLKVTSGDDRPSGRSTLTRPARSPRTNQP